MSIRSPEPPGAPPSHVEEELRAIYDGMAEGLLLADIETKRLLRANPAACRMFGYSEEEMVRLSVSDLHPPDEVPEVFKHFRLLTREQLGRAPGCRCVRKDGTVFYADVNNSRLRYQGRDCVIGFFRDVTEARKTKEALAETEARFRAVFEGAALGIALVDLQGRTLECNQRLAEMLGYTREELLGKNYQDVTHPEDQPEELAKFLQLQAGSLQTLRLEKRYLHKSGGIVWGRLTASLLYDAAGRPQYAIGVVEDITDRKRAEQARQEAEEALHKEQELLRQLLELAERDRELLAFEIHDGFAQQLAGAKMQFDSAAGLQEANPQQARQAFEKGLQLLREGIQESRRLVSGLHPPVLDAFGVVPAIEHLVLQSQSPGGPEIEFAPEVQFGRLARTLENAIFRIVQESLTNAQKHSQSPQIRVELSADDRKVYVTVRDWGVGFDPEGNVEGHFGLRGIRERARLFHGLATIESAPGQGTTIRVELPLVPRARD
jgi:PAS domain S-box-containing protein